MKPAMDAAERVANAISGPGTPESIKVVQRHSKLSNWVKDLSGPAVGIMLIGFALLTADWIPFFGKQSIWNESTEQIRAQGVTTALIILAACVSVVLWVSWAGKPSSTEISAGSARIKIETADTDGDDA
jgi:hypothetical protein